ncbi:MAG TPA: hypothetical protein PLF22_09515 [Pseudomonadales bacterium]|nr:hypothetical protein [Pseudomonadales bacterium]
MEFTNNEHLSYAMQNHAAREHFLNINAPSQLLDWSHLAIETVMILGALLGFVHALRTAKKSGSPSALYTFAGIFIYGLVMDISSYYSVGNFWHGEFSVMLVWNRLPLYIAMLYPALIYHCYMTIRRYAFPRITEAVCAGFYSGIIYMIFDNLGPSLNWWIWDRSSPFSQPLLNSVPLTSYHWLFLFNTALAFWLRTFAWDALAENKMMKARLGTVLIPVLTILLGGVLFIPYDLFLFAFKNMIAVSVMIHAVTFFLAGYWFLLQYRKPTAGADPLLMFFPVLWIVAHLYIYIAKYEKLWAVTADGLNRDGLAVGNLFVVAAAMVIGTVITLASHPAKK